MGRTCRATSSGYRSHLHAVLRPVHDFSLEEDVSCGGGCGMRAPWGAGAPLFREPAVLPLRCVRAEASLLGQVHVQNLRARHGTV